MSDRKITNLDKRISDRVRRRWKRRARILAPLASIPLLLATLVLSVDLIEYAPLNSRLEAAEPSRPNNEKPTQASFAARAAFPALDDPKTPLMGGMTNDENPFDMNAIPRNDFLKNLFPASAKLDHQASQQ